MMVLSAFFSGTETALVSASRIHLASRADSGDRASRRAVSLLDKAEDVLGMILIGNNLANIAATSFLTFIATRSFLLGERELLIVTAVQTIVFLVFCEITPKLVARGFSDAYLRNFSGVIGFFIMVFKPATLVSSFLTGKVKALLGVEGSVNAPVQSRDEIDTLFQIGGEAGIIDEHNRLFVSEILSFKELMAREVMTPIVEMESIEAGDSMRNLVLMIGRTGFSRIPMYRERVDNIIGYIFYRDLLEHEREQGGGRVEDYVEPAIYVPETRNLYELYIEMQERHLPLVFVVNEYGGVVGMITHEDIAEEVVGEIQTRDHSEELVIRINDNRYQLEGTLALDYLKRKFGISLEGRNYDTIAGYMLYRLGRIPRKGEKVRTRRATFTVDEADERGIQKVIMQLNRTG
jgi:CBS domain containing-hemolysin-like protein